MRKIRSALTGMLHTIKLLFNPKDVQSLLKLGNLLTDLESSHLYVEKVKADGDAAQLISERYAPELPSLADLEKFPNQSLGKAYFDHMRQNSLSPYLISINRDVPEKVYLREKQRVLHDVFHALFGLGIQLNEEAQLNAILMARTGAPVSIIIVAGTFFHTLFKNPKDFFPLLESVSRGWKIGSQIKNPFGIRWEERLSEPVDVLRRELGLAAAG